MLLGAACPWCARAWPRAGRVSLPMLCPTKGWHLGASIAPRPTLLRGCARFSGCRTKPRSLPCISLDGGAWGQDQQAALLVKQSPQNPNTSTKKCFWLWWGHGKVSESALNWQEPVPLACSSLSTHLLTKSACSSQCGYCPSFP